MGYVFDPDALHDIVRQVIGQPLPKMIADLREALEPQYGAHLLPGDDWVFNNAGGAMGQMLVLHASLTEYLMIFGTPTGTEGHSGRFMAKDYCFVLEGEQWAYAEGELEKRVYRPGDLHVLEPGGAEGYRMPDRCFVLDYARGVIPAMLPFGVADTLSSTLDVPGLARTFAVYTRGTLQSLRRGKI